MLAALEHGHPYLDGSNDCGTRGVRTDITDKTDTLPSLPSLPWPARSDVDHPVSNPIRPPTHQPLATAATGAAVSYNRYKMRRPTCRPGHSDHRRGFI